MKSAKIRNGRIVDVVQGIIPDGYIEVNVMWTLPTEYPYDFYNTESTKPLLTVIDGDVFEDFNFILKSVDDIKNKLMDLVEEKKETRLNEPFDVDGEPVQLSNEDDINHIANLSPTSKAYRIRKGKRIKGSVKIKALKKAVRKHIEEQDDWESDRDDEIENLTTHLELRDYHNNLS